MNLKSIKLENFGCFKELSLSVPETGLIYIDGENRDESFSERNGVGKSTILDSIPWALYGRTLRESGKKKLHQREVIRQRSSSASVTLELEDNGTIFKVGRDVNRTKGSFCLEVMGETLKGDNAVDFFKKKFDLNFPAFLSSCLFGQGMSNLFLSSTEEEKMGILEELFKLKELEDIRSAIKNLQSEEGNVLVTESANLRIIEVEYRAQETRYALLKELHDKSRKEAQDTLSRINPSYTLSRIDQIDSIIKRTNSEKDEILKRIHLKKVEVAKLEMENSKQLFNIGEKCPTCHQTIQNIPPEFRDYHAKVKANEAKIATINTSINQDDDLIKSAVDHLGKLNEEYYKLKSDLKNQEEAIARAKEILGLSNDILEKNLDTLKDLEKRYVNLKEIVDTLTEEREHNSKLYKILGEKELRGLIVNKSLALVNYYAKQYVSFLTNGIMDIEFEFKSNKILATINHRTQGKLSYLRYSGGERRRIDFGMFLAFNRVNRTIFNTPLSILLLDETFDALDNAGIEKCVELLKQEVQNIGLILVTGHAENISELFDQKILLVKKGGVTYIA